MADPPACALCGLCLCVCCVCVCVVSVCVVALCVLCLCVCCVCVCVLCLCVLSLCVCCVCVCVLCLCVCCGRVCVDALCVLWLCVCCVCVCVVAVCVPWLCVCCVCVVSVCVLSLCVCCGSVCVVALTRLRVPARCSSDANEMLSVCGRVMKALVQTPAYCGLFSQLDGAFRSCLRAMPSLAIQLASACVQDVCAEQKTKPAKRASCAMLAYFANICFSRGFRIVWRVAANCRKSLRTLRYMVTARAANDCYQQSLSTITANITVNNTANRHCQLCQSNVTANCLCQPSLSTVTLNLKSEPAL